MQFYWHTATLINFHIICLLSCHIAQSDSRNRVQWWTHWFHTTAKHDTNDNDPVITQQCFQDHTCHCTASHFILFICLFLFVVDLHSCAWVFFILRQAGSPLRWFPNQVSNSFPALQGRCLTTGPLGQPLKKWVLSVTLSRHNWTWIILVWNWMVKALCLLCKHSMAMLTEYDVLQHHQTKHSFQYFQLEGQQKLGQLEKLKQNISSWCNFFTKMKS